MTPYEVRWIAGPPPLQCGPVRDRSKATGRSSSVEGRRSPISTISSGTYRRLNPHRSRPRCSEPSVPQIFEGERPDRPRSELRISVGDTRPWLFQERSRRSVIPITRAAVEREAPIRSSPGWPSMRTILARGCALIDATSTSLTPRAPRSDSPAPVPLELERSRLWTTGRAYSFSFGIDCRLP